MNLTTRTGSLLFAFLLISLSACESTSKFPPDKAFKKFSHWAKMGQPQGMERFSNKEFVEEVRNRYDGLTYLSELWPKEPVVLETNIEGEKATVKAEGLQFNGNPIVGTFHLEKQETGWKVVSGRWGQSIFDDEEEDDTY